MINILYYRYELSYKQQVSATDVFFGMDQDKDPGSRSSDAICVHIELPKSKDSADMNIDINADHLTLISKD